VKNITKVAFALVCILSISSLGLVNAATTWKPFKQCNMVYWTSEDPTLYGVAGNQVSDFKLSLDGNPDTWYYLDIKSIKPDISVGSEYSCAVFPFYLDQESLADNEAFWNYWETKLAEPLANGEMWAFLMYWILQSDFPMFMLKATPTGQYMLVDYLQFAAEFDGVNFVFNPLRINGDYPQGTYTFVGHGNPAEDFAVGIYPDNDYDYLDNPLSDVTMTITFR
jgi:hypothetical protein